MLFLESVWVPVNEKLEDKIRDVAQWSLAEDFSGWKVCNDGAKLAPGVKGASMSSINLSFNGLGDDEIAKIAPGLEGNKNIAKLNLANNFIHVSLIRRLDFTLLFRHHTLLQHNSRKRA